MALKKFLIETRLTSSKILLDDFIKECMDNSNEAYDIPREVKNNINRMAMEQATPKGFETS